MAGHRPAVFNDGLHQWPATGLHDEVFEGRVWALAVPSAVVELADQVADWVAKNPQASPYVSESFGGYSYTKATNPATGQAAGWEDVFRRSLNRWRKLPLC